MASFLSIICYTALLLSVWPSLVKGSGKIVRVPNRVYSGPSRSEFKSGHAGLDNQKILPWANATSFEWWYFDVVSTSSANESVVAVFYESLPEAFISALNNSFLSASLSGTFKNGSIFNFVTQIPANAFTEIHYGADEISGVWADSGFGFRGQGVLKGHAAYTVEIDSPKEGIKGTISYRALAPAHYACGANAPYSSENVMPNIGWSNAIPNAASVVDLWIQGEHVSFTGAGYHDKNWGDKPFTEVVGSWYWGHAEFGPYFVVWFDTLAADGGGYVSGYVVKDGEVLLSSCKAGAVKARPHGGNDKYPPVLSNEFPAGFIIEFTLPGGEKLHLSVSTDTFLVAFAAYFRFVGKASGGIDGESFEGKALSEQFTFRSS